TKGQISGFDSVEGYDYFKTDADIDAGNSGGTMLDADGKFVGIPSYLISYYENSGRVLKITEAENWIDSTRGDRGTMNTSASQRLREEWKMYYDASTSGKFTFNDTPKLSIDIPNGWEFYAVSDTDLVIGKSDNQSAFIQLKISSNGFKLNMTTDERIEVLKKVFGEDAFENQDIIKIDGVDAVHFWEDLSDGSKHIISFAYGYKELVIIYTVPKNEKSVVEKDITYFLNSMAFASQNADDTSPSQALNVTNYPFTIKTPSVLRVVTDEITGSTLAHILRNTNKLESFKVYYSEYDGDVSYTMEEGLEYDVDHYIPSDADIVFESDELILDGLPGWIYIYEYTEYDTAQKAASVTITDPEYEIYFELETEVDEFDAQLNHFIATLKSFKSKRYENFDSGWDDIFDKGLQGTYNVPYPGASESGLSDITGHRYEDSIKNLVKMEVLGGYSDGSFKPENPVNRAEALKIILQSLRSLQEEEGGESFVMPENFNNFSDLKTEDWYATYVAEGVDKGIISGYPDGTFKGGNTVNLAEALKMTLVAHEANIWEGDSDPWHRKYFDAAYALDLLPQDLTDPGKFLTRAELSYIVDQLVSE
ncbi:MAG: hypothetical protein DRP08_08115, partial [Candidatus Aenigmatarchaeota archaeon]